jgi:hypothetical protein
MTDKQITFNQMKPGKMYSAMWITNTIIFLCLTKPVKTMTDPLTLKTSDKEGFVVQILVLIDFDENINRRTDGDIIQKKHGQFMNIMGGKSRFDKLGFYKIRTERNHVYFILLLKNNYFKLNYRLLTCLWCNGSLGILPEEYFRSFTIELIYEF